MDDFIYQVKLKQIEDCADVKELVDMFKKLFKVHTDINSIYGDGCIHFSSMPNKESYNSSYASILVSDLLGNIYNRLIDSKQMTTDNLKSLLSKPFPPIDKEQARHLEASEEEVDTNIIKLQQQISALEAFKGYLK